MQNKTGAIWPVTDVCIVVRQQMAAYLSSKANFFWRTSFSTSMSQLNPYSFPWDQAEVAQEKKNDEGENDVGLQIKDFDSVLPTYLEANVT